MSASWPEPVERVAAFLRETGVDARLEEFADSHSAEAAAKAAGCPIGQIVKTLVLVCDGKPVVALVPGDRRADLKKIARAAQAVEARIAKPDEVRDATGFAPGAVSPFPLPKVEQVLIDQQLLGHEVVWVGAGSPAHMAALAPAALSRIARARAVDAVEDAAYHSPREETH